MIERLAPEIRREIAAGEVVTRPARAVTELVENALDAGADRVDVRVAGDGTERLSVADDGAGMSRADAERAVQRHTTSKLGDEGLEGVRTLGFRGEALASIAEAAARLTLTTADGDGEATRVTVADGERTVEPAGRARGTTVEVAGLFEGWPARRESLAGPGTEFGRVADAVGTYALLRPGVAFSLTHDGTETFATPGSGDYADAAMAVYDREVARRSTAFEGETRLDDRTLAVEGLLAYPSVTRASREHVHAGVDGRAVTDDTVRRAVVEGYGSLLPGDRYPIAVVSVSTPPGFVDPNVHPAKERVAFRDADAVADAVRGAVADALTTADLRRSGEVAMDLDAALEPVAGESRFAGAEVLGSFRELYVVCEADGDLLVVDQHAAHERVNYERLRAGLAGEAVPTAPLDPPEAVSLTPGEAALVGDHREELAALGFELRPFGGKSYRLAAVPAPLGRTADAGALRDALDAIRAGGDPEDRREELLKDLACHPSLKAGDALGAEEAAGLLERLGACDRPFACPHGRPTVLAIEEAALARGFERSGRRLG